MKNTIARSLSVQSLPLKLEHFHHSRRRPQRLSRRMERQANKSNIGGGYWPALPFGWGMEVVAPNKPHVFNGNPDHNSDFLNILGALRFLLITPASLLPPPTTI